MTDERRTEVRIRITRPQMTRIDAYAKRLGVTRNAAIALVVENGLQNAGQAAIDFDTTTGDTL